VDVTDRSVGAAVDALAGVVSHALRTSIESHAADAFSLWRDVSGQDEEYEARLAALRVLGADALTPYVLAGHALAAEDADLVAQALRAHPAPDGRDADDTRLWGLRDWAVTSVLGRLREQPVPEAPALPGGATLPWQAWCGELMRLSSLALPEVRGPLRDEVARRGLDLGRGLARAVLRRDHLGAARLVRWQALEHPGDRYLPAAIDHLGQLAGEVPRVRLELTLAGLLLRGGR
jgi:hypothetical protein